MKKRAAVKRAISAPKAKAPVKNPYSKNPFSKNFSPSAFIDGAGSRQSDVKHIKGAKAYENQRDAALNKVAKSRMKKRKSADILDLF